MTTPHEQERLRRQAEEDRARAEAFASRVQTPARLVQAAGDHAPAAVRGAGAAASFLANTGRLVTGIDNAVHGDPQERASNLMTAGQGGAGMVGSTARLVSSLGENPVAEQVSRRASQVGAAFSIASNVADINAHGASEQNVGGIVSAVAGTAGTVPALVYTGSNFMGQVALARSDQASVDERLYPHTAAAGRAANSGTRTEHETGTDAASRAGLATQTNWQRNHRSASELIGAAARIDLTAREVFGGARDDGAVERGAEIAGGVSAMGHAVANTVRGVGVDGINHAYGSRPANPAVMRALGVDHVYTPYELSQMPTYDVDHPPPARPR